MAGARDQQTVRFKIPVGEAQRVYSPGSLAYKVENFVVTEEDTLRALRGPCEYEHKPSSVYSANMPGLFHAGLDGGTSDTLLLRSGENMYRHAGWNRGWELIETGLEDDVRPMYPDQFVVINNRIVWSNGIDRARVISGDGSVHPMGFQHEPSAPIADGPTPPKLTKKLLKTSNTDGYSFLGRIGTSSLGVGASEQLSIGKLENISPKFSSSLKYSGIVDRMLKSKYYYYCQFEDIHGNLSAMSDRSNAVTIYDDRTYPQVGVNLDDITRQLLVRLGGESPENAVAVRLYRTPDVNTVSAKPRMLVRIPGRGVALYPDNIPDAELGAEAADTVSVPRFKIATAYQGRLVIGNLQEDEGAIRVSEPGYPGTFVRHMLAIPDSGGAEITGLASHAGGLYAFTRNSMYTIEIRPEGLLFTPITQGVGCVAPGSIRGTASGLIWLGADAFYMLKGSQVVSISNTISKTVRSELSRTRMRAAVAVVDGETGEYRCAVTKAGSKYNDLMLCFGEVGWRRLDMGKQIGAMCTTDDDRRYTLFTGTEYVKVPSENPSASGGHGLPTAGFEPGFVDEARSSVFVLDRERTGFRDNSPAVNAMNSVYRSAWFRADDIGLTPFNVRMMYIGMLDSAADTTGLDDDAKITIRFYKNGRWVPVTEIEDVLAAGVHTPAPAGEAIVGTDAVVTDRRPFWRKVNPDLANVDTWAFEIEASCKTRLHLQAFAFDISTVGAGTPHGRIPRGEDL